MASKLREDYPWTTGPVIINAPMAGFACAPLATAVTQAGGIGMIGIVDAAALATQLQNAADFFSSPPSQSQPESPPSSIPTPSSSPAAFYQTTNLLPVGVGLLLFLLGTPESVLPALQARPPALLWLFAAPTPADYAPWTTALRAALPQTKLWIQVGSASAALEVARTAAPDVLVLQGSDAGGHGFARSASVVSLLPETAARLAAAELEPTTTTTTPTLVAAGGMAGGKGAAAALALGAAGVVMGTRFLAAAEATVHPAYRAAVLGARDGALETVRAGVFDELRGPSIWPAMYDGRAIASQSYREWAEGVDVGVLRERYAVAAAGEDRGYASRAAVWAGAGVGLVNEVRPAGEILKRVREEAKIALREALEGI